MSPLLIIIGIAVVTAIVAALWVAGGYNSLVTLRNRFKNAFAQIDVQLKRRYDLIPNLVESAKDYMGYEQETLKQVIEARNSAITANKGGGVPSQASVAAESALTASLGRFFALSENYPNLKANETVQKLMEELAGTENKIGFARQFYNDSATAYNTAVLSFPNNLIAAGYKFELAELWRVAEAERATIEATPKVDLR